MTVGEDAAQTTKLKHFRIGDIDENVMHQIQDSELN